MREKVRMNPEKVLQFLAVYLMLNQEMKEGNFLKKRFQNVKTAFDGQKTDVGIWYGAHLDMVATLLAQGQYFSDTDPQIPYFLRAGKFNEYNASVNEVEAGRVSDVTGNVIESRGRFYFRPSHIVSQHVDGLRTKAGFLEYVMQMDAESDGIRITNGTMDLYGSQCAPSGRKGMLTSFGLDEIANRLYDRHRAVNPAQTSQTE
jgi:hypothetical protein